jgi:nucleotide-binding universal stress UspA family protein
MNVFANRRIVVPIDFSEEADRALNLAMQIADSVDHIRAVHVAPPLVVFEPSVYEILNDDERSERLQASFATRYADGKYRGISFDVLFGDPGQQIAIFAKEMKAGLIVMSSHGRTGLAHLLIGSVAERVLRLASCPALILRSDLT